jgi:hypothetical protein
METVGWRTNCWKALLLILVSLGFVGIGVVYIALVGSGNPLECLLMAGCTLVFALFTCVAVWMLIDRRPRIVLDQYGILDRKIGVGRIAWSDIVHAYIQTFGSGRIGRQDFICLEIRNEAEYLRKARPIKRLMAAGNRWLGFTPMVVNLGATDADAHDVLWLIFEFKRCSIESAPEELARTRNRDGL